MFLPESARKAMAYADPQFAASFNTFGAPARLEHSGAIVLLTHASPEGALDAVGPYPLLSCPRPDLLVTDLDQLRDLGAVTLTAVLDPLGPPAVPDARLEVLRAFKTHFITSPPAHDRPSKHHRREVRIARPRVSVVIEDGNQADVDAWMSLWSGLVDRHHLVGMRAGSRETFASQFSLPGATVMWAFVLGELVAAQIVLMTERVAYAHLAVTTRRGRDSRAMYALDAALLEMAETQRRTIHWGGDAGFSGAEDGLIAYKRGWANATCEAQLLGAILDPVEYARLVGSDAPSPSGWFPAYQDPLRRATTRRRVNHG